MGNTNTGSLKAAHHKVHGRADFREVVNEATLTARGGWGSY